MLQEDYLRRAAIREGKVRLQDDQRDDLLNEIEDIVQKVFDQRIDEQYKGGQ